MRSVDARVSDSRCRPSWSRTLAAGALLSVAVAGRAAAQSGLREAERWEGREAGLSLSLGLGRGQFHDFVKVAGGVGGYAAFPIALHGALRARADLSVLFHGFDTWSGSPPIETDSYITTFRLGPQVALNAGPLQFYGFWGGGFSYFATDADPQDACDCEFTRTLHDDWTWADELGGGVRIALGSAPDSPALDLGIRALRNGEATYITRSGITQNADGSFTIRPIRSEANLIVIHLGLSGLLQ